MAEINLIKALKEAQGEMLVEEMSVEQLQSVKEIVEEEMVAINQELTLRVQKEIKEQKPKELSKKEEADLEKKRKVLRDLHDCFTNDSLFDAEAGLSELEGLIEGMFFVFKDKITVKELELGEEITDDKKKILEVLAECTVAEGVAFARAMRNAIDYNKYDYIKDITVKGLDIELL